MCKDSSWGGTGGIVDGRESSNKKDRSNSHSGIISASIGAAGVIIAALIAALIGHATGVTNIFFWGTATPHPTVTVTVTRPVGVVSGSPPVSPAPLKQALLSAQVVGSAMSVTSSTDAFLSSVTQDAGICGAQPVDGARSTVSEELKDSPKLTAIFIERIIDWGSTLEAAQSITNDEAALGQSGCNFTSNSTAQKFFPALSSGSSPQGCSSGNELVASVALSSSEYSGYGGIFIEVECKTFTISIENVSGSYNTDAEAQTDGYLNTAAGRLLPTIR
jgi:hypothetical protein